MPTKKTKLKRKEIAWYVISGILAFVGLVFVVFGIVGDHLPVKASDNWVIISEKAWLSNWSHIGYRVWGIILVAAGALIAAIALTLFAKEGDRDTERAQRRAQRLAIEAEPLPVQEAEVVEAPKEEAKPSEPSEQTK